MLLLCNLCACSATGDLQPTAAQIESIGIRSNQGRQDEAFELLQYWANRGMPVAQRELAMALLQTRGDAVRARAWFEQAAQGGDAEAALRLGEAYYSNRLGVTKDDAIARKYYRMGAEHGDNRAALMLARMARYGEGGNRDPGESVRWLALAAERGNAQAMFLLSNAYQSGDGVASDEALAGTWLEKAAAADYPPAIQALALAVEGGAMQFRQDPVRARHLFKEAAEERRDHSSD